jgi:putrescine transport system ATP-binding protein
MAPSVREIEPWRDPSARPYIRIDRVSKSFGAQLAVDDVSLDIYQGELFSLLGGSGCGKTTLLRMLAGFIGPDAGTIAIDGTDIVPLPPYARPVNMMFQSYALFPHMSVENNVAFGLRRDGVPSDEIKRRVAAVLDLVQMGEFARRKPAQLSCGQRQRVALARSIVKRPKVLLLDEPLSALDKKLREATQFELITIQEQVGITFIMVTHDQSEAMTMSTRIAVMDRGRIVQIGKPSEIYETPKNRFVADFVGSVNLFEGTLKQASPGRSVIASEAAGTDLAATGDAGKAPGETVWVAVRPERIRLAKPGAESDLPNRLGGTIKDVAYLGDSCVYHVALGTGMVMKVTAPSQGRWAEQPFQREDRVELGWLPGASMVMGS